LAKGVSTVVEQFTHNPKIEGSNASIGTMEEKTVKKVFHNIFMQQNGPFYTCFSLTNGVNTSFSTKQLLYHVRYWSTLLYK
jgi:hypothetical protein